MQFDEAHRLLKELAAEQGLLLFDVVMPQGRRGVLRLFIYRDNPSASNVGQEDCAKLARQILDLDNVEELMPHDCTLEVSTPGINRVLRTQEHFAGAIGERVKISHRDESGRVKQIRGVLKATSEGQLVLESIKSPHTEITVALATVTRSSVDFVFD
jgi:ribosome maturation factor RimP